MPLSCSQLSVLYGHRRALSDFSLSMERGEIRALIGPNGSGKSTALQALAGLLSPAEGGALIEGVAVASMSRRAIAKKLAFLPQQPTAPDEMTVAQLVRQGAFPMSACFVPTFAGTKKPSNGHWTAQGSPALQTARSSNCPAANANARGYRRPWRKKRRSCSSTSRRPFSISAIRSRSWTSSIA